MSVAISGVECTRMPCTNLERLVSNSATSPVPSVERTLTMSPGCGFLITLITRSLSPGDVKETSGVFCAVAIDLHQEAAGDHLGHQFTVPKPARLGLPHGFL